MWNKDNSIRIVKEITKEYGREILDEGSKSVRGFENYVDKMIAKILGIESEIVTAAREWRSVLERAAMHEGMDNIKKVIEWENAGIANNEAKFEVKELNIIQEETTQVEITRTENIIDKIELESIEEEMQITVESSSQEEKKRKEEGKIIQKEEANIADIKETNRDMIEIENKVKERKIEFLYERNTEE